jgi:hypothetical protein
VPALAKRRARPRGWPALLLAAACACALAPGCKPKATTTECDALIERYAALVVTETYPDASAEVVRKEQEREKTEARSTDSLKNCSSEVSRAEMGCAMQAKTTTAFEKCLE